MTIQELKDFFSKSDFSEISKSKIMSILDGKEKLGNGIFSQIKAVMQEELDSDFNDAGIGVSSNPEAQAAKKDYDEKLEKIGSELDEDMNFLENELKDLEEMRNQVIKADDDIKADKIRQSI
ncbi:MAG TPA: hypothetical protein VK675_01340 [Candidatus Paceibacterota bacterium]|nr:hypothetical protein [Candidatus Paceibacterota bacterium]